MRLDKYLKVARLIKRRTVANEACDNERVTVNGRPAKASYDVKVGDILEIRFGQKALKIEVLAVAEAVRKDDAAAMYRELPGLSKLCLDLPGREFNALALNSRSIEIDAGDFLSPAHTPCSSVVTTLTVAFSTKKPPRRNDRCS